jgi:uncharacterized membrane protein
MKNRIWILITLALAGLAVSAYLLTVHWGWWSAVCLGVGDCELVNTSRYSEFLGMPVALFGLGAYAAILALTLAALRGIQPEWTRRGMFAMGAVGVAFSTYLTYIELFVLHEICPWCVLSAIIIFTIAVLSALELRDADNDELQTE